MKLMTYLMSFEQMIQLLQDNGVNIDDRLVVSLPLSPARLICNGRRVVLSNDLREKFLGTWWEVELSTNNQMPSQCFYLADSLQDAFRLRPDIDTSYWCSAEEDTRQFLAEVSSWQEDEYFLE
jgi:hypothetical protein